MKLSPAGGSLFLFGLSVILLILLTLFESALTEMSLWMDKPGAQRKANMGSGHWHCVKHSIRNLSLDGHLICRLAKGTRYVLSFVWS